MGGCCTTTTTSANINTMSNIFKNSGVLSSDPLNSGIFVSTLSVPNMMMNSSIESYKEIGVITAENFV